MVNKWNQTLLNSTETLSAPCYSQDYTPRVYVLLQGNCSTKELLKALFGQL